MTFLYFSPVSSRSNPSIEIHKFLVVKLFHSRDSVLDDRVNNEKDIKPFLFEHLEERQVPFGSERFTSKVVIFEFGHTCDDIYQTRSSALCHRNKLRTSHPSEKFGHRSPSSGRKGFHKLVRFCTPMWIPSFKFFPNALFFRDLGKEVKVGACNAYGLNFWRAQADFASEP